MDFLLILAVIGGAVLVWGLWDAIRPKPELFCPTCGHTGEPKNASRGSTGIEVTLWILALILAFAYFWPFIFTGLIYTLWRSSTNYNACGMCGAAGLIPPDSPAARRQSRDLRP